MLSFKYRRKILLFTICVVTLITVHIILVERSNFQIQSWNQNELSRNLGGVVAKSGHGRYSFSRSIASTVDQEDELETFLMKLLSNDTFRSKFSVYNKTHILYIPASKLIRINERTDDLETGDDLFPNDNRRNSITSPNFTRIPINDTNGENGEILREHVPYGNNLDEDIDNEFDITDLDDHITFTQQPNPQTQSNKKELQLSERNRLKWNGLYDIKLNNSLEYRTEVYNAHVRPIQNTAEIDCNAIVETNDENEIDKAINHTKLIPRRGTSTRRFVRTTDCENFRGGRGYIEHPLSQMELDFPLAFEISAYRDVEQAERLLRAIYRPHNFYCFHLDLKMSAKERTAFENIARCLNNVFIANTSVNVTWGTFSVLEAELLCMEKLWQYKRWKYYINLTGQEFPLKTNREIVAILDSLEGANIVDGTWIRAREKYFYRWTIAGNPPPHRIRPIKGSIHVAVNRQFVDFALHDQRSLDFLEWLKKTQIPDETFYASLNHNPHLGINGSFLGDAEEYPLKPSLMRYKNWEMNHGVFVRDCAGKYVRNICVLGVGDLHKAYSDIGLFANKFNIDFEYLALDCLEEVLYQKTWNQYLNDVTIDTTYFKHLDYVKKKLYIPS